MGRTDGKLVTFLRGGLLKNTYVNLKYEDEANDLLSLEFPRFEKSREHSYNEFAKIFKGWYKCNGKGEKYVSYSNAKAVFQAALKKSVYLVSLPAIGKKLIFRFATNEEVKEKRKALKEKEKAREVPLGAETGPPNCESPLHTITDPPSVSLDYSSGEDSLYTRYGPPSASSGYSSGEDPFSTTYGSPVSSGYSSGEDQLYTTYDSPAASGCSSGKDVEEKKIEAMEHDDNSIDNILKDLEKYFECGGEDLSALTNFINEPIKNDLSQIQVACPVQQQNLMMPVVEVKFYWQLSQKFNFDSVLLLTFRKQLFIENERSYNPGDIIIPNETWEKREYIWKNAVELNEKLFLFFEKI